MSERLKEMAHYAGKWLREAGEEWGESVRDYPIPHFFTLIAGGVLVTVARWFL